jgi:putative addiction module CopG family antidote
MVIQVKSKGSTVNISLPTSLRAQLEKKLQRHAYSSASEYVRELIRQDLQRQAVEQVDALLLEGLNSSASPMTDSDWDDLYAIAGRTPARRHAEKKAHQARRRSA